MLLDTPHGLGKGNAVATLLWVVVRTLLTNIMMKEECWEMFSLTIIKYEFHIVDLSFKDDTNLLKNSDSVEANLE